MFDTLIEDAVKRLGYTKGSDYDSLSALLRASDIDVYSFPQTWGSTALGFGGIGGQMVTKAQTVVVVAHWTADKGAEGARGLVYFGGGFAYEAPLTRAFMDAVNSRRMPAVSDRAKVMKVMK